MLTAYWSQESPSSPVIQELRRLRLYLSLRQIERNERPPHVEWSVNEKVALEVAAGASYCDVRAVVVMKHVGLNVAADPLMTLSRTPVLKAA